jgi:hypothetical protein
MAIDSSEFFNQRMELLATGDIDALVAQYASDAEIVRFLGVTRGHEAIRAYLVGFLAAHQSHKLVSLDQMQQSDDAFDGSGKVSRQFPGIQGYWGSS